MQIPESFRTGLLLACSFLLASSGALAQDRLELDDGWIIEYYLALPQEGAGPWPLAVFMGGGSGNRPISFDVYRFYARELAALGWAVVVPISPDNSSFRGANIARVQALIDNLQSRDDVQRGKSLLAGISAGGMSALEIARRSPEDFYGVMAVPALVRDETGLDALAGMPVYLRIGGADELGWASQYDATVTALTDAGAQVDARLLYGEPHMFGLDWELVSAWLETVR